METFVSAVGRAQCTGNAVEMPHDMGDITSVELVSYNLVLGELRMSARFKMVQSAQNLLQKALSTNEYSPRCGCCSETRFNVWK